MIDWHCHILPGIDDGAAEIEHSLAMARSLAAAGFKEVCATPHLMKGCFEATHSVVLQKTAELQERLESCSIAVQLRPSREYVLDEYLLTYLENPLLLGNDRSILVEIPPRITTDMVRRLMYDVVRSGFKPVIAHPERCHLLEPILSPVAGKGLMGRLKKLFGGSGQKSSTDEPFTTTGNPLLDYLRDLGCCFQGNLGSFSGFYGRQVQSVADSLRNLGVYDRYGSDLHSAEHARLILQQPIVQ